MYNDFGPTLEHDPVNRWAYDKKTPWYRRGAVWASVGALAVGVVGGLLAAPVAAPSTDTSPSVACLDALDAADRDLNMLVDISTRYADIALALYDGDISTANRGVNEVVPIVDDYAENSTYADRAATCRGEYE